MRILGDWFNVWRHVHDCHKRIDKLVKQLLSLSESVRTNQDAINMILDRLDGKED